jgi:transcriptional regulator with XRE-family HTH domain
VSSPAGARSGQRRPPPTGSAPRSSGGEAPPESSAAPESPSLGDFIREQRETARLSLRKLSDMAQISNPYLSQIERGLRKPSAEILQQLARALRISAETLYVQAGILDERVEGSSLEDAIAADRTLTDAQKRALLQVYRSFQTENTPP